MRSRYVATLGVLTSGLFLAVSPAPLKAQHAISEMDLKVRNVRASGQPVLPIFEGWYRNPDGTYDLCFGYLNLNQEEALEIPLGPDNFIEPERFDGGQPTHFLDDATRLTCIFTVNVPEDIGSERVWWNLRIDGQTYKVPGHVTSRAYMIENLSASFPPLIEEEQIATFGDLRMQSERVGATSPGVAPVVRFVEPAGPEGRGKSGMTAGPVTTRVGNPLALAIRVTGPDGGGLSNDGSVRWGQAPRAAWRGDVQRGNEPLLRGLGNYTVDRSDVQRARGLRGVCAGAPGVIWQPVLLDQRIRQGARHFLTPCWRLLRHTLRSLARASVGLHHRDKGRPPNEEFSYPVQRCYSLAHRR